ncbi:2'-5' RNA ligase family protein [Parasphingorhabdus litoris]|uniref:2'-5' RNA ligase family protein n=1 Tax=Parasphingorhabdus litoris TaxID=394733 RepID=A0ABP3K4M5_9SPHN|nr:2'-5' RNA ligase family protein [Parasphingorhabdus litoris]
MTALNKPIIMTAMMGKQDFAWADNLRRQHYPPERNMLPAHITLFHHLPPQACDEIKQVIIELTRQSAPPKATLQRLIHLGTGVGYQIHSPALTEMRMEMADQFHGLLVAQDQQTPRLHVTIQNKVSPKEAKDLITRLSLDFETRPFEIKGLALHHYMDGPWKLIGEWPFRG